MAQVLNNFMLYVGLFVLVCAPGPFQKAEWPSMGRGWGWSRSLAIPANTDTVCCGEPRELLLSQHYSSDGAGHKNSRSKHDG